MTAFEAAVSHIVNEPSDDTAIALPGRTITWRDVSTFARALDGRLRELGIGEGARVGVISRNRAPHLSALWGLLGTRRCAVIINPFQSPERLVADMERLGLAALVGSRSDLDNELVASLSRERGWPLLLLSDDPEEPLSLANAVDGPVSYKPTEAVVDFSTSGTTGLPKRVEFSGDTVLAAGLNMKEMYAEIEGTETAAAARPVIMFYPLPNISGAAFLFYAAVARRGVVLLEKFDTGEWLTAMRDFPQRVAYLPPAAVRMIVDADVPVSVFDGVKAGRSGAAPLEDDLRDSFETRYGVPILSHYGASEFCGVVTSNRLDEYLRLRDVKRGSLGRARTGVSLRVCDPTTGEALPPGAQGILEVHVERVGPSWLRTSDLARIDEDGFLFLDGRADDAINRGGFKILPQIVADTLRRHPAVRDVVVLGLPDARLGSVPAALIEGRAGVEVPSEADLSAFARKHLLAYQIPVRFRIVESLPRTATMKVDRVAALNLLNAD